MSAGDDPKNQMALKVNGRLMRVERMTGFAGSGFSL
jgi:hypothetical protein